MPHASQSLTTAPDDAPPSRHGPTDQQTAAIGDQLRQGVSVQAALLLADIPMATFYAWMNAADGHWPNGVNVDPGTAAVCARFRDSILRAQAECEAEMQRTLHTASKLRVGERDWRAADAWLSKAEATRRRWHEHRELKLEHVGTIGHEHRIVHELPDTQLLELASPDLAGLIEAPAGE